MWPGRYFCRFWAARYWVKVGATPGEIVNRRPTTDPGTVGTRSPDTRMGGL